MWEGFEGTSIAVVYDSSCEHTQAVAGSVARGVTSVKGVEALLLKVEDISPYWAVLERADGMNFGGPRYGGGASANFKVFMEAASRNVAAKGYKYKWADKVAAGFTNLLSDVSDAVITLQQIAIFAAQHQMHCDRQQSRPAQFFFLARPRNQAQIEARTPHPPTPICGLPNLSEHALPKRPPNSTRDAQYWKHSEMPVDDLEAGNRLGKLISQML